MQLFSHYYHQKQTQKALEDPRQWKQVLLTPRQIYRAVIRRMGAVTAVSLLFIGVGMWAGGSMANNSASATDAITANAVPKPVYKKILDNPEISALIANNSQYQIGVTIESVASGQQQSYGVTTPFVAASTSKLIVAAAYYKGVERGALSLDTPLQNYPASYQIMQMVQQSNNNSWDLLVAQMGRPALQSYAKEIGIDYTTGINTLSTRGMATFLTKLYQGKLLNKEHTNQLLGYMQQTNDELLIPAAVSKGVMVHHKYGLFDGTLHDAAIITKDGESYALVIYTNDDTDSTDPQRTALIHRITELVESQIFS